MMETTMYERQVALEEEMKDLGISRYQRDLQKSGDVNMPPGLGLMRTLFGDVSTHIGTYIDDLKQGNARNKGQSIAMMSKFSPDTLTYLTLKYMINGVSGRDTFNTVAMTISSALRDELEYREFKNRAPGLVHKVEKQLKTVPNEQHKRRVRMHVKRKVANIPQDTEELDKALALKVGVKLIELVIEATGAFKVETVTTNRYGKPHSKTYLKGTDTILKWLEDGHKHCAIMSPVYLPTIIPPKDWKGIFSGGYHTFKLSLVKTRNKAYLEELQHVEMPGVYQAINSLQQTPWRINKGIYRVLTELWENYKGGEAGLPLRDGLPLPPKPVDIDSNKVALKHWKQKAAAVYNHNHKTMSKCLAVTQKLWVAEKFLNESAIYMPYTLDWRGRIYTVPSFVTPQGDDSGKALLEFADGKPLGANGAFWLAVHLANNYGYDKASFDDRVQWVIDNEDQILDSALNPIVGKRWWMDADNPFQCLAACMEWAGYKMQGDDYVSHLPVQLDGSCNGLQNFSAMLRDKVGGKATNLIPSDTPSDIYGEVAKVATEIIREDAAEGVEYASVWSGNMHIKQTKRKNMTLP
jgi:DNA-directed RNA polymerase